MNVFGDMLMERLLGRFVWLDSERRSYDLAGGTFSLRCVRIREDLFNGLGMPFAIRGGEICEIEVRSCPGLNFQPSFVIICPVVLFWSRPESLVAVICRPCIVELHPLRTKSLFQKHSGVVCA